MTKPLEQLFDLACPDNNHNGDVSVMDELKKLSNKHQDIVRAQSIMDRIDQALPGQNDLDGTDQELDELADLAKEKFEDLMNLGMNVEARYSGQILQTAGMLLGHAITARQAKIDKKLRVVDLQLKKLKLDQTSNTVTHTAIDVEAMVIDRNRLFRQITNTDCENSGKNTK